MRVHAAIHAYLDHQEQSSRRALETVFEPALDEELLTLTSARLTELRAYLATRTRQATNVPQAERIQHTYLRFSQAFLTWCAAQGWTLAELGLVLDPESPSEGSTESQAERLGALVRALRQEAGLTRQELGQRIGLDKSKLTDLEAGRCKLTRGAMEQLLTDPAMESLPERAQAAGLSLELADDEVPRRGKPS